MTLYFITGNKSKFAEVRHLIPAIIQKDIELTEIQQLDAKKIIRHKLQEALKYIKGDIIVEDTSLYINSLKGLPGPLSKWFLKTIGYEGLYRIAQLSADRSAVARAIIGYARSPSDIHFFEGDVKGTIVQPKGPGLFGWDRIFQPDGSTKTFGEMTIEEKSKISHRQAAVLKLKEYLDRSSPKIG